MRIRTALLLFLLNPMTAGAFTLTSADQALGLKADTVYFPNAALPVFLKISSNSNEPDFDGKIAKIGTVGNVGEISNGAMSKPGGTWSSTTSVTIEAQTIVFLAKIPENGILSLTVDIAGKTAPISKKFNVAAAPVRTDDVYAKIVKYKQAQVISEPMKVVSTAYLVEAGKKVTQTSQITEVNYGAPTSSKQVTFANGITKTVANMPINATEKKKLKDGISKKFLDPSNLPALIGLTGNGGLITMIIKNKSDGFGATMVVYDKEVWSVESGTFIDLDWARFADGSPSLVMSRRNTWDWKQHKGYRFASKESLFDFGASDDFGSSLIVYSLVTVK